MRTQLQFYRRLAGYRSAKAFADSFGINVSTYTQYERGLIDFSAERAWELADALGCTVDELLGRDMPSSTPLTGREGRLLAAYRKTSDTGRAALDAVAKILEDEADGIKAPEGVPSE